MLRTVTLFLLLLVSVGVMIPLADSAAHGIRQSSVSKSQPHYRRHSRAWWRRYRARVKRRRAAALAHRRSLLAPSFPRPTATEQTRTSAGMPILPSGWNRVTGENTVEMRFRTDTDKASVPGQVALSVVAQSRPTPGFITAREERRLLAGIAITDLRRIVIDKMMTSGGWVTNDFQRLVAGNRVFVVTAQTPGDARTPEKTWNFYFTEVNGRIYSLTTNTPRQFSDRMAVEAEGFIASLHANVTPTSNVTSNVTPTSQSTNR
jgi:hypothetical protein